MNIKNFFRDSAILFGSSFIIDFLLSLFMKYPLLSFNHWSSQIILFSFLFSFCVAILRNTELKFYFIFQLIFSFVIPLLFSYSQLFFVVLNFWQTAILSFIIYNLLGTFFYFFWIKWNPDYMKILSFTLISALMSSFLIKIIFSHIHILSFTKFQFYPIFIENIAIFLISSFSIFAGEYILYFLFDKNQKINEIDDFDAVD